MTSRVAAVGGLLVLLTAGQATAGPLPVTWSYRNPLNEIAFPDGASGGLTFPNTVFQSLTGEGEIAATKLSSYSIAPAANPDRVTSLPYRFTLDLRDDLSGDTASLMFEGVFSGRLWRTGGDLRNTFAGETARTVNLGGTRYTVSLTGFDGPDGYGDGAAGAILARVRVADLTAPGPEPVIVPTAPDSPSVNTPEPATVLLALAGLPLAWIARSRRWTR